MTNTTEHAVQTASYRKGNHTSHSSSSDCEEFHSVHAFFQNL